MIDQEKMLNDVEYMYQADTKGMFQSLTALAGQCTTACWDLPRDIDLPAVEAISNVVKA